MLKRIAIWMCVFAAAIVVVPPALAHHSYAMFDKNKKITIKGVVSKIEWTNPHVSVFVKTIDSKGKTVTYWLECSSPNELKRWGWKINSVKQGEKVTVELFALKDGRAGGLLYKLTGPDGKQYHAH